MRTSDNLLVASAVDLFCGAGGLSYGLRQAGISVCAGVDHDPDCAYPFSVNNKAEFYQRDLLAERNDWAASLFPSESNVRVLAGCAPCQPFSAHNKGRIPSNDQWRLLTKFGAIITAIRPEIVAMENVPRLPRHVTFNDFVDGLRDCGYRVSWSVVQCSHYGIPQNRNRLVLLASLFSEISLRPPLMQQQRTVRDTIHGLPAISNGAANHEDRMHRCRKLSDLNLLRIQASKPGGSWLDWEPALRNKCHLKATGSTYGSVYGRMCWDRPSPTITTQFTTYGTGRFGHPEQDRALSLREGALLQTFPSEYRFVPDEQPVKISSVAKLIGNAVPCELGEVIGQSVLWHLHKHKQRT